jgi:hypothetical protein
MKTLNLRKRVQILERCMASAASPYTRDRIVKGALHRLSDDELQALRVLALEREQGTAHRERTAAEMAAVTAYNDAFRIEMDLARSAANSRS